MPTFTSPSTQTQGSISDFATGLRCSSSPHFLSDWPQPPGLYNDRKGSQAHGPLQRTQTSPIPGRLADQVPVSGGNPSEHTGSGRSTQSLGWIINQEKSELISSQVYTFMHYEYHLDSTLVKPTQERWLKLQDLILRLKSKHVLTARCLMSQIGLPTFNGEDGPGGTPSHEGLSVSSQGALEISSVIGLPPSLDRVLFCTSRLVAESCKRAERRGPPSQDHSIQLFSDASNEGWGARLEQVLQRVCGQTRRIGYT